MTTSWQSADAEAPEFAFEVYLCDAESPHASSETATSMTAYID